MYRYLRSDPLPKDKGSVIDIVMSLVISLRLVLIQSAYPYEGMIPRRSGCGQINGTYVAVTVM